MASEPRTEPKFQLVQREADIANLIPGDRVKVVMNGDRESHWMVYGGHNTPKLERLTKCTFIELPERYPEGEASYFMVWESQLIYLQFSDQGVRFDALHRNLRWIHNGTEEYDGIKNLAYLLGGYSK